MNSSLKQVAALIKLSAIFRSSAWRSNKTLSELNEVLGGESSNPPQAISHEDEGKDGHVGMDESSTLADETCNPSWSELASKLRAERINLPQIAFSDEDEDDSFTGLDEGSMAEDKTDISSWSDEVAKLRAEKANRPNIILLDDDEGENNIVSMDKGAMVVDEAHNEKYFKFKRPSSVRWTDVEGNANRVSLFGSISSLLKFKRSDSGQGYVCWTFIDMRDENFLNTDRLRLCFWNKLALIARQHLKTGDFVYVSGKLVQIQHKLWIEVEDFKFVQRPVTPNIDDRKFVQQPITRNIGRSRFRKW